MSKVQYDSFLKMREFFHKEVETLHEVIPILIPVSEEDEQTFALMLNMLQDIDRRLQAAETLGDVSDLLNMDALEDPWEEQQHLIMNISKEARKYIYEKTEADYHKTVEEAM